MGVFEGVELLFASAVAVVLRPVASGLDALRLLAEAGAAVATLGLVAATPGASVAAWLRPGGLDEQLHDGHDAVAVLRARRARAD